MGATPSALSTASGSSVTSLQGATPMDGADWSVQLSVSDVCGADEHLSGIIDDRFGDGCESVVASPAPSSELTAPLGCDAPATSGTLDDEDAPQSADSCRTTAVDDLAVTCWLDDVREWWFRVISLAVTLLAVLLEQATGGPTSTVGTLVETGFR